jgi:large subunit ribosomal protein L3
MAGQMGNVNPTQQGLEVVKVDAERHLIAVKGAVPGATGGDVIIRPTTKG